MQALTFRVMRASVKRTQVTDIYTVSLSSLIENAGTIVLECSTNTALSTSHDYEPFVSPRVMAGPVKSRECAFQSCCMIFANINDNREPEAG
jgi:hypothetical protein